MNTSEVFAVESGTPAWVNKNKNTLLVPVQAIDKLPKIEIKVHMCCAKCAEIVDEEIREVEGVVSVKVEKKSGKVTVFGNPDPLRVLKKSRKVDKRAEFWSDPTPVKVKEEKTKTPPPVVVEAYPSVNYIPYSEYRPSQSYPPNHYGEYPETDYSRVLFTNPNYMKHIRY